MSRSKLREDHVLLALPPMPLAARHRDDDDDADGDNNNNDDDEEDDEECQDDEDGDDKTISNLLQCLRDAMCFTFDTCD